MCGMEEEMELRKKTLNRINIDRDRVIRNSLNLIALFLEK
jgi:hypothetical protein